MKNRKDSNRLEYLENENSCKGQEDYITYIDFKVDDGSVDMWLYEIYEGIQLLICDMNTSSCFREVNKQNVIAINHCRTGRFECIFDKQNVYFIGDGDIAISSMKHLPRQSSIPLRHFYGSTIIIFPDTAGKNQIIKELGINFEEFVQKYSLDDSCYLYRRNEEIEHIYNEIYESLKKPNLAFLKLKLAELLFRFSSKEVVLEKNNTYLSKQTVERIKKVKEHLLEDMETRIPLKELAAEHGMSLTQLKDNFKKIYGVSPYAYLKEYKINAAAKMLIETDKKIGDIAIECAYRNPSKFTDAFFSVMGCTPKEYRLKYKSN